MPDQIVKHVNVAYKLVMPILVAFVGWVFVQFWNETKEIKAEIVGLRLDVAAQSQRYEIGLLELAHRLNTHENRAAQ